MKRKRKQLRLSAATIIVPPKHTGIIKLVQQLIAEEMYAATGHAKLRLDQREVSMMEVRAALLSGKRATAADVFHTHDAGGFEINRWSYAFVKQGLDRKIKVCVSIDESKNKPLLIVTVIDLD